MGPAVVGEMEGGGLKKRHANKLRLYGKKGVTGGGRGRKWGRDVRKAGAREGWRRWVGEGRGSQ